MNPSHSNASAEPQEQRPEIVLQHFRMGVVSTARYGIGQTIASTNETPATLDNLQASVPFKPELTSPDVVAYRAEQEAKRAAAAIINESIQPIIADSLLQDAQEQAAQQGRNIISATYDQIEAANVQNTETIIQTASDYVGGYEDLTSAPQELTNV